MNLLIIDDEVLTVKLILENIDWTKLGIDRVFTAYDAREAKQVIRDESIQIILCDIEMPGESGIEFLRWMKKETDCDAVSLLLTCHDDFSYAKDAISLGVKEYILKPVLFDDLAGYVRDAISAYKVRSAEKEELKASRMWQNLDARSEESADSEALLLKKSIDFIKSHVEEDLDRQYVADHVHLNVDYLSKFFKRKTGMTLTEYIRNERMNYAGYLLTHTGRSVNDIAFSIGFSSQSHFSSAFRNQFGCTPLEYKNRAK